VPALSGGAIFDDEGLPHAACVGAGPVRRAALLRGSERLDGGGEGRGCAPDEVRAPGEGCGVMTKSIEELASEIATVIVGISPDAPRTRGQDESAFDVSERRKQLDRRTKIEALLVAFGRACVKAAREEQKS
jgi:hypothetical protein